ncbi:hypothetical protein [Streptomyces sp. UNOB3_S3]|uniref:hypothetical protein n=1 Tax=Streptomyces sp. UNOB3_S3 TaxID=2871682 RepID=UPI001E46FD57|nr:hypothetical protein [Streptomyces sp. UNOB3_S3]MCC3774959.1 hypothetical protein [Streptomyces sp. UNOB3_S3]
MTDGSDDTDRIFVRSRLGPNRYVYNPENPVGLALIVGSLLFAIGGMYLVHHPGLLSGSNTWDGGELRSAVNAATAELSSEAQFGPGVINYEDVLRSSIAKHGHSSQDALAVKLASEPPKPVLFEDGVEKADYTVTAEGTDTAFCLRVYAVKRKLAMRYDALSISISDGACAVS